MRISVLDKGWIELQDVMGDDTAIVNAARISYLGESKGEEADKKLLMYLYKNGHMSPFEMAEMKFRVHAPLVVWWQWTRHRLFSYNASSGRYTEFEQENFYVPQEWRLQSLTNKQGSEGTYSGTVITKLLEEHYTTSYRLYQHALKLGIAKEQARLFLPGFAMYYTFVVKTNVRNLMHFMKMRRDEHAQWEIRQYADVIYDNFFKPNFPWCAEAYETL